MAWVGDIRINNLVDLVCPRHLVSIFSGKNDEFKSPEPIMVESKATTDRRAFRVAQEPKV
jgi:hypothetical protein